LLLLLLQRLSPNVKFQKFGNNFKLKILKICHTFLHIGTQIICVEFRENQRKNVGGVAICKKFDNTRETQSPILSALLASVAENDEIMLL